MTNVQEQIRQLVAAGTNYDSLIEIINSLKTQEEQEKKRAELTAARERVADSVIQYLLNLDLIKAEDLEQLNFNDIMASMEEMEKELIQLAKVPEVIPMFFRKRKPAEEQPKVKVKIKPSSHMSAEQAEAVFKDFLRRMEGA